MQSISPPSSGWQRNLTMSCCAGWPAWRAVGCTWRKMTPRRPLAFCARFADLSTDFHQHHFIGMYIGLALFRRGDFAGAAVEWHEAMRNAIAVAHLRGIAGSVEGCGYIAERLGKSRGSLPILERSGAVSPACGVAAIQLLVSPQ